MIIVKLMGGLGNQLFQYATAKALSLRHGVPLKLDLSFLESDQTGNTPRTFELKHFRITAERASRWESCTMSGREASFIEKAASCFFRMFAGHRYYREKWFHFDPELLTLPDNVYLEGYWQSSLYFSDIRKIIMKEFTGVSPLSGKNQEVADQIRNVNAVSLHVRRGDYVLDEKTRAMHGVCDLEYYQNAEQQIIQSLENPCFFVFSDDPDWVANNLKLPFTANYIRHNSGMGHEDLRLMSLCRHHVIANSSFSWWGAWLSSHPDKMVIAPKRWFNDPSINTNDLIPSDWHRL